MKSISEIIDICDMANGVSVTLDWEEWQTLKAHCTQPTASNTASPKLPANCGECPLNEICRPQVELNSIRCTEARRQLRA